MLKVSWKEPYSTQSKPSPSSKLPSYCSKDRKLGLIVGVFCIWNCLNLRDGHAHRGCSEHINLRSILRRVDLIGLIHVCDSLLIKRPYFKILRKFVNSKLHEVKIKS